MLRIFKDYNPFSIILVFIIAVSFWLSAYNQSFDTLRSDILVDMPLYASITKLIKNLGFNWLAPSIAFLLLIIQAFQLTSLNDLLTNNRSKGFLLGLVFVLLFMSYIPLNKIHPVLFANIFIIQGIHRIFKGYGLNKANYNYFDANLLFGIATLFYGGSILMFVFSIISLMVLRPYKINEWMIMILGYLTPMIFFVGVYYIVEGEILSIFDTINRIFKIKYTPTIDYKKIVFLSIIALFVLRASTYMIRLYTQLSLAQRNYFLLLFWIFVLSLVGYIVFPWNGMEIIYLALIPVSFMITIMFQNFRSKFWGELTLWFLVLSFIGLHIFFYLK